MGVEYGRRVREGIEIREPVAGGVSSPVTANGRRSFDVGAPDQRRRHTNPLLAPAPFDTTDSTERAGNEGRSRAGDGPGSGHRRRDPKRRPSSDRAGGATRRPAAKRGRAEQPREESPESDPDPERDGRPSGHGVVCTVGMCPICAVVTAMGDVRPELTEHLLLAGRELLLALKSLIDARAQTGEDPPAGSGGLERITIE